MIEVGDSKLCWEYRALQILEQPVLPFVMIQFNRYLLSDCKAQTLVLGVIPADKSLKWKSDFISTQNRKAWGTCFKAYFWLSTINTYLLIFLFFLADYRFPLSPYSFLASLTVIPV